MLSVFFLDSPSVVNSTGGMNNILSNDILFGVLMRIMMMVVVVVEESTVKRPDTPN